MYSKYGLANWICSAKWGKLVGNGQWPTAISSSVSYRFYSKPYCGCSQLVSCGQTLQVYFHVGPLLLTEQVPLTDRLQLLKAIICSEQTQGLAMLNYSNCDISALFKTLYLFGNMQLYDHVITSYVCSCELICIWNYENYFYENLLSAKFYATKIQSHTVGVTGKCPRKFNQ